MILYITIGLILSLIPVVVLYRSMDPPITYLDHFMISFACMWVMTAIIVLWPILLLIGAIALVLYLFTNVFAT